MLRKSKNKITGVFFGTIVEYYDYSLYGFSAGIIASKFFPMKNEIVSLMYVYAIYALSYGAKPIGSIFFSRIGDKYGRKIVLSITMIGIALPTLMIGLLPEYQHIGYIGTYILVICRFFQGFFTAGEYDGAAIYVIEHLGNKYHYTASSLTRATGVIGLLLGIASTNFFNSSIFPDWGWRIPFLLSAPLALTAMYFRQFLEETPDFNKTKLENIQYNNIISFIKKRWVILLSVVFLAGGFGATYQVAIIFMKQYLPIIAPYTKNVMSFFSVIIVLGFGLAMPISGLLSDNFGVLFVIRCSLLSTLFSCLLLFIAIHYQLINLILTSCILLAVSIAPFNALAHGVIVKSFKTNERYRGVGIGHSMGALLMSGTANYICLYFMDKFNWTMFPIFYVGFFAIVAYITIVILLSQQRHLSL